jgi:hypothetical protein
VFLQEHLLYKYVCTNVYEVTGLLIDTHNGIVGIFLWDVIFRGSREGRFYRRRIDRERAALQGRVRIKEERGFSPCGTGSSRILSAADEHVYS